VRVESGTGGRVCECAVSATLGMGAGRPGA